MTATIRLATPHDAAGIQAVYAPVVRETAISFEVEPPSVDDMRQRIVAVVERCPGDRSPVPAPRRTDQLNVPRGLNLTYNTEQRAPGHCGATVCGG